MAEQGKVSDGEEIVELPVEDQAADLGDAFSGLEDFFSGEKEEEEVVVLPDQELLSDQGFDAKDYVARLFSELHFNSQEIKEIKERHLNGRDGDKREVRNFAVAAIVADAFHQEKMYSHQHPNGMDDEELRKQMNSKLLQLALRAIDNRKGDYSLYNIDASIVDAGLEEVGCFNHRRMMEDNETGERHRRTFAYYAYGIHEDEKLEDKLAERVRKGMGLYDVNINKLAIMIAEKMVELYPILKERAITEQAVTVTELSQLIIAYKAIESLNDSRLRQCSSEIMEGKAPIKLKFRAVLSNVAYDNCGMIGRLERKGEVVVGDMKIGDASDADRMRKSEPDYAVYGQSTGLDAIGYIARVFSSQYPQTEAALKSWQRYLSFYDRMGKRYSALPKMFRAVLSIDNMDEPAYVHIDSSREEFEEHIYDTVLECAMADIIKGRPYNPEILYEYAVDAALENIAKTDNLFYRENRKMRRLKVAKFSRSVQAEEFSESEEEENPVDYEAERDAVRSMLIHVPVVPGTDEIAECMLKLFPVLEDEYARESAITPRELCYVVCSDRVLEEIMDPEVRRGAEMLVRGVRTNPMMKWLGLLNMVGYDNCIAVNRMIAGADERGYGRSDMIEGGCRDDR